MNAAKCRSCGRDIIWARTQHGKPVPLDPKALVFSVASEKGQLVAVSLTGHRGPTGDQIMVSHFATCPDANQWSGQKREPTPQRDFNEPKDIGGTD